MKSTTNSWTYDNRLNQVESLDANDLAVIDDIHTNFKLRVENPVDAEEWVAVERVLKRLWQDRHNLQSKLDQAEEYIRELEIEADGG